MATLKENSDSWSATSIIRRDFRHSHDGTEETPHRKKKGKTTPKKKPGCPGNDGNAHIYVWVSSRYDYNTTPAGRFVQHDRVRVKHAYRTSPHYNPVFYGWTPFDSQEEHIAWLEARETQICAGCCKRSGKQRMKEDQSPDKSWWGWY